MFVDGQNTVHLPGITKVCEFVCGLVDGQNTVQLPGIIKELYH